MQGAMRVIIADDSDMIRERLQQMLCSNMKVQLVGSFRNGLDALDAMRTLNPDLAIIDIKMPGKSGLGILKEIRDENISVKILMLTFYSSEFYRQQAMKNGADYFLSKVDDFEKIPAVIDRILISLSGNGAG